MRLTPEECEVLRDAARRQFGTAAKLFLFGSRLDDNRRGGDIDLLIETSLTDPEAIVSAHLGFLVDVYARLGERKIDVLIDYPGRQIKNPIYDIAREQGVLL
jgi:predicted nucleotidyltransferase